MKYGNEHYFTNATFVRTADHCEGGTQATATRRRLSNTANTKNKGKPIAMSVMLAGSGIDWAVMVVEPLNPSVDCASAFGRMLNAIVLEISNGVTNDGMASVPLGE